MSNFNRSGDLKLGDRPSPKNEWFQKLKISKNVLLKYDLVLASSGMETGLFPDLLIFYFSKAFPNSLLTDLYIYSISLQDKQLNHNTADGVILTNRSLVLQGIDRTRSGGYTCQALNAVGSGQSQVIELDVKCKTFIYYA